MYIIFTISFLGNYLENKIGPKNPGLEFYVPFKNKIEFI